MKDKKKIIEIAKSKKIEDANILDNNDKRNKLIILIVGIILLILTCLAIKYTLNNNKELTDSIKFKEEYESLNNKELEGTTYKHLPLSIDEDNIIKYSTYEEVFDIIDNSSGVIYFGYPECPWCRSLIEVLLSSAEEVGIDTIYYLNIKEDRNTLEIDDNKKVIETKEGSENYNKLLEKLGNFASDYQLDGVKTNQKRLYFPTLLFVKEGKIVDIHEGTLDTIENPFNKLEEEKENELKEILTEKLEKVIICDGAC